MNGFQIKIGILVTTLFYLSITNIMSIDTSKLDKKKLDTHAGNYYYKRGFS